MFLKALTIFLASCILFFVIELVRKEKLTFKYAVSWIFVSTLAILLAIFDNVLFQLAKIFSFQLASNFIFFSLLTVFVFISLLMTIFLCQQNRRNDSIAQKLSILEFELNELKNKNNNASRKNETDDA